MISVYLLLDLSEPYENVSLMKHAVSLKGTNIFP